MAMSSVTSPILAPMSNVMAFPGRQLLIKRANGKCRESKFCCACQNGSLERDDRRVNHRRSESRDETDTQSGVGERKQSHPALGAPLRKA